MNTIFGKIVELGGISTLFIILLWKFILEPIYKKSIDFISKSTEIKEKNLLEIQSKMLSKKLEVETIKLERVLPRLEEISEGILSHHMLYNTYFNLMVNKVEFPEKYEKNRVDIDNLVGKNLSRITIYLPKELQSLFFEIRKIISCSWQSTHFVNEIIQNSEFEKYEIIEEATRILELYRDCFNTLINRYCNIDNTEKEYSDILTMYGFDTKGKFIYNTPKEKFVKVLLLLSEYATNEEKRILWDKVS